jgi:hypothetical protein
MKLRHYRDTKQYCVGIEHDIVVVIKFYQPKNTHLRHLHLCVLYFRFFSAVNVVWVRT